jgi:hypothetical protein
MKKQVVLIACMMAGAIVFAQERGKGHHGYDVAAEMKKELSLNDDQYQRIKSVDESYRAKFHDLRADSTKSKEEKMTTMKSLGDARKKAVEGILTPDQQAKWQAAQAARKEQHQAQFQKAADDRALKLKSDLSLTDQQFSRVQDANKAFREKASQLKQKSGDTDAQKAEFKKLREGYDESMKSILNKDQYKKWQEMKKSHKGHHGRERKKGA